MSGNSKALHFGIDIDPEEIVKSVTSATERESFNSRYFDNDDGRYISCQVDGKLISASYHETKHHSATCEVHNHFRQMFGAEDEIVRSAKSDAKPGEWAVACCTAGKLGGNKTYYNTYD